MGRAKKSCSIYSLLGPRFVSYYVNNLSDEVTEGELAMCADDTTLSVVGDNVEVVIDKRSPSKYQPVVQKQQADHTHREVRSHDFDS